MSPYNIPRRTFLATLGALTIPGSLVQNSHGAPIAQGGSMQGRIRKAVKYHMIEGAMPAGDKLKMLKDLGFDGVEVRAMLESSQADEVKRILQASEKTNVPIHGLIHSSNPNLKGAIDQAVQYGATSVLHVVRYNTEGSYLDNYRQTQDILRRAADHAEKSKVAILIENVWASFLIEPLSMARFIDEIGSEFVQAYFDIGNVVRWGWPQHWIEVLGKRVRKLDVKEFDVQIAMNSGMRKGFDVPMGSGSIEWAKVRDELLKIDYRGWATAEVRGGDRERLAEIAKQMDEVFLL